jgi:phage portal protein BeeE
MKKLIIAGKAKKVFSIIEAIANKHPDMPLALYNGDNLKSEQYGIKIMKEEFMQNIIKPSKNIEMN